LITYHCSAQYWTEMTIMFNTRGTDNNQQQWWTLLLHKLFCVPKLMQFYGKGDKNNNTFSQLGDWSSMLQQKSDDYFLTRIRAECHYTVLDACTI
jgi:hypothetical protein